MEESMKMNEQATQAESVGKETGVQSSDDKGERLFTQEEVNAFVQSRIARMKGQLSKETQAEYTQKMQELQAREMKLMVKEKLSDRGMPRELADIITCTDERDIDVKLDALQKIYGDAPDKGKEQEPSGFVQVGTAGGTGARSVGDPVRKAMGLE